MVLRFIFVHSMFQKLLIQYAIANFGILYSNLVQMCLLYLLFVFGMLIHMFDSSQVTPTLVISPSFLVLGKEESYPLIFLMLVFILFCHALIHHVFRSN